MSKENFQEWRESPVTELFLKYCEDLSDREGNFAKMDFLSGALHTRHPCDLALVAGKAIAWAELSEIDFEEIEAFYTVKENYEEARESDSDTAV